MKTTFKKIKDQAKRAQGLFVMTAMIFSLGSCMGEVKEKLKTAKKGVLNATTFVKEAQKVEGKIEKLKEAVPLTNEQLKDWLPEKLGSLDRTGFKVGQAGMYQVNSVEGTFKNTEGKQKFNVTVIDGAGPTGSMMAASYGLLGNFDMEEEDEYKHKKTVEVDGIKAQQTYKKRANDTQLLFAYQERFLVTINASDMNVDETWRTVEKMNFETLVDLTE